MIYLIDFNALKVKRDLPPLLHGNHLLFCELTDTRYTPSRSPIGSQRELLFALSGWWEDYGLEPSGGLITPPPRYPARCRRSSDGDLPVLPAVHSKWAFALGRWPDSNRHTRVWRSRGSAFELHRRAPPSFRGVSAVAFGARRGFVSLRPHTRGCQMAGLAPATSPPITGALYLL